MYNYVYVLDNKGVPFMPTKRFGKVRRMLRDGKAKIVKSKPFTIQLTYETETNVRQDVTLGIDPGRTNIGTATATDSGRCHFRCKCTTRNKAIRKLMEDRKKARQASRRGERLARKRLAKKHKTTMKNDLERMLPRYKSPVIVKCIINTEARYLNRKREEGWLTPTATQLKRTHINLVKKIAQILPVTNIAIELNKFAFMELDNPNIKKWEYQNGPLKGYSSVKELVAKQQDNHCLLCKKPIEHYHHIVPRHLNGSNAIGNIAGLCDKCHERVHKDDNYKLKLEKKKSGMNKKYDALSTLNQIIPSLINELNTMYPDHVFVTTGKSTKTFREDYGIEKNHDLDAWCIACSIIENEITEKPETDCYEIKQFRRHDRAIIKRQEERTYYYNSKAIAKNRNKRIEQKNDSLSDWYEKQLHLHGEKVARQMLSKVTVKKSTRAYNDTKRMLPGFIVKYKGKRLCISGRKNNGAYYLSNEIDKPYIKASECKVLAQNTGLVFI